MLYLQSNNPLFIIHYYVDYICKEDIEKVSNLIKNMFVTLSFTL